MSTANMQKNTRSFRLNSALKGGLYGAQMYVAAKFNRDAYDSAANVDASTLKFASTESVYIAKGEKGRGSLASFVKVSECGKFGMFRNSKAESGIMALDIVEHEILSVAELVQRAIKRNELHVVKRLESGEEITGFLVGSLGELYCFAVSTANGKVVMHDIETKRNAYNAHRICAVGDAAKVASKKGELTERLHKALATLAEKGKKAVVTRVKATGKKDKAAQNASVSGDNTAEAGK